MTPASPPDGFCPNCGKQFVDAKPACECGHSYYPRTITSPPAGVPAPATEEQRRASYATGGMALGIFSLFAAVYGPLGLILIIIGFWLSVKGLQSEYRTRALVGLVCSSIGFLISVVGWAIFGLGFLKSLG